jgi:hypothetical protein
MRVVKFKTKEDWLNSREMCISGTKLKDITPKTRGLGRKIGFYKLAAEYLALNDDTVDGRDRGNDLEEEGVKELSNKLGIEFIYSENEIWVSDEHPSMIYSPDGYTKDLTVTAELKHLGSARHLEIIDNDSIPSEFWLQIIQSFIVNDKQDTHFFCSRDPRVTSKPVWYKKTSRIDIQDDIEYYKNIELNVLSDVKDFVEKIGF